MALKRPPPEVAATAENAVTAVKKHAKPSVNTRDFFIFVISLVTKDIYILCKIFDFMTFKESFVGFIIQPLFWICQTNFNKKLHIFSKRGEMEDLREGPQGGRRNTVLRSKIKKKPHENADFFTDFLSGRGFLFPKCRKVLGVR